LLLRPDISGQIASESPTAGGEVRSLLLRSRIWERRRIVV
jgi:hypothetical protein